MNEALEILARVGTDSAPTLAELTSARDTIARELHALKASGTSDLEALLALKDSYALAAQAVTEAETAEAAAANEIADLLEDIPNPDAEETDEVEEETPEAVAASGSVLSVREAAARLGLTPSAAPEATSPVSDAPTTTVHLNGVEATDATWRDMAMAVKDSTRSMRKGKDRVVQLTTDFGDDRMLAGKTDENTRLVDSFVTPEAVAAAGGCCSLAQPIYDNPVQGSLARPIRDALPSFGTPRGKVTFFPAVCLPDQGAAIWTCEDDLAVDPTDETTWKQCFTPDCPEEQEVPIDAIYSCLEIGNFTQRFAPEQWEAYLRAVSVLQARMAEVALFAKMRDQVSTTHTLTATGSVYATLLNGVALAAATIRQDQRLSDVTLDLFLPEWILAAVRSDLRSRRLSCPDTIEATDAIIAQAFSNEGVRAVYSPDIDPIEEESPGQVDGPLTLYPAVASAVLAPNGFFTFLDGGTLDLGTEIRDHALNRQNKVAAFAESWEGLLSRGCNAKALDIPVEVCNSAPCPA